MDVVSRRIEEYMTQRLGMDEVTIKTLRPRYLRQYGTTMRGLMVERGIDADDYLAYVHGFSAQQFLACNEELDRVLAQMPWRKVVFTSSTREHTQHVLTALGIAQHFERTFDIRDTGYVCKPDPAAYDVVLRALDLPADECLLADDSLPNLQVAARLGMVTVWVGSQESAAGVDWAIARIEDIAHVTQELLREAGRCRIREHGLSTG